MINYCKTCALRLPDQNVCPILNREIDPNKDFCSNHQTELKICEVCGNPYIGSDIIDIETDPARPHIMCTNCWTLMYHCGSCLHSDHCAFETDPSPLPHVVMQTIQNGPMTMQTQIQNPERVKITCEKGCSCYRKNEGCVRQNKNNTCENYQFIGYH